MPLFPKLVGGVTVREKPRRREGEPKYKRLEFIRPKLPGDEDTDSWPIIYSTEPVRGIQLYQPAYHPHWHPAYHHQHHYPNQAAQFAAQHGVHWNHPAVQGRYPPGHPIHRVPAPALSNGHKPKQIEARHALDSDNEIIEVINDAKKGKKKANGKGKEKGKKKVDIGHVIFEDSSDSESDYVRVKAKKNHHRHR